MIRAVEMFRWGSVAWLMGGLAATIVGITAGDPRATMFTAAFGLIGLLASLSGQVQLVLAKRAGQLDRVHGARLFHESGRGFVQVRP